MTTERNLPGLEGFETTIYALPEGVDIPEGFNRHEEIDKHVDLIVAIVNAKGDDEDLGRAIRYSLVILDTEKLRLDWKRAKEIEGIDALHERYLKGDK